MLGMNRKILLTGILITALLIGLIAVWNVAPTKAELGGEWKVFTFQVVDEYGNPVKNVDVIFAIGNETENFFVAKTPAHLVLNETGWLVTPDGGLLEIWCPESPRDGTFNVTLLMVETVGDHTFYRILYAADNLEWSDVLALNWTKIEYPDSKRRAVIFQTQTSGGQPFNGGKFGGVSVKVIETVTIDDTTEDVVLWESGVNETGHTGIFNFTLREATDVEVKYWAEGEEGYLRYSPADTTFKIQVFWHDMKVYETEMSATDLDAYDFKPNPCTLTVSVARWSVTIHDINDNPIEFVGQDCEVFVQTPGGSLIDKGRVGADGVSEELYFPDTEVTIVVRYYGVDVASVTDNFFSEAPTVKTDLVKVAYIRIYSPALDYSRISVRYTILKGAYKSFNVSVQVVYEHGEGKYAYVPLIPYTSDGSAYFFPAGYLPVGSVKVEIFKDGNLINTTTIKITSDKYGTGFDISLEVTEAVIKIVGLDGEVLSADEYPEGTFKLIDVDTGKVLLTGSLPSTSIIYVGPAATVTVNITWKGGVELTPITEPQTLLGTISTPIEFKFPVTNVGVTFTRKDGVPVEGLNVSVVYPDGFVEKWFRTNSSGMITIKHVPVGVALRFEVYAWNTPYTRTFSSAPTTLGPDDNVLVANVTETVPETTSELVTLTVATGIVNMHITAVDYFGNPLSEVNVTYTNDKSASYPVVLVLVDKHGIYFSKTIGYQEGGQWLRRKEEWDYRLVLQSSDGEFTLESVKPEETLEEIEPGYYYAVAHYFIEGQKYWVRVFYAGVPVFNGTIAGAEDVTLKCSVVPLRVAALSRYKIDGSYVAIPGVNIQLGYTPALNRTYDGKDIFTSDFYSLLTGTDFSGYEVDGGYFWLPAKTTETDKGYAEFLVPVWPTYTSGWTISYEGGDVIKNGTYIDHFVVHIGTNYGTPGVSEDDVDITDYVEIPAHPWNVTKMGVNWNVTLVPVFGPVEVKVLNPIGEPLSGQDVVMYVGETAVSTKTTDSDGVVKFGGLDDIKDGEVELWNGTYPVARSDANVFWYGGDWAGFYAFETKDKTAESLAEVVKSERGKDLLVPILREPETGFMYFETPPSAPIELRWSGIYVHLADLKGDDVANAVILLTPRYASGVGDRYVAVAVTDAKGRAVILMGGVVSPITGEYVSLSDLGSKGFLFEAFWDKSALEDASLTAVKVISSEMTPQELESLLNTGMVYELPRAHLYDFKIVFKSTFDVDSVVAFVKVPTGEVKKLTLSNIRAGVDNIMTVGSQLPEGLYEIMLYAAVKVAGTTCYIPLMPKPEALTVTGTTGYFKYEVSIPSYTVAVKVVSTGAMNAPLSGARVKITYTLRSAESPVFGEPTITTKTVDLGEYTLDSEGKSPEITVPATGTLSVTLVEWKGVSINKALGSVEVRESGVYSFAYTDLGVLVVKVVGRKNIGLPGAGVVIKYNGKTVESGSTDEGGVFTAVLPAGTYTVDVFFKGYEGSASASVAAGATKDVVITLSEVYMIVFGRPVTFSMFVGMIVGVIVAVIIITIALYEYSLLRRRRALALVPAAPPKA